MVIPLWLNLLNEIHEDFIGVGKSVHGGDPLSPVKLEELELCHGGKKKKKKKKNRSSRHSSGRWQ